MSPNGGPVIGVGYDGSAACVRAVEWAADQARRTGGSLVVISAGPGYGPPWPSAEVTRHQRPWARVQVHAGARLALLCAGPGVAIRTSGHSEPAVAALVGESVGCDLLVIGMHRGFPASHPLTNLLGQVSRDVAVRAACPVALVGDLVPARPARRLVLIRSWQADADDRSMDWATQQAGRDGVELTVVTYWDVPPLFGDEDLVEHRGAVSRRAAAVHRALLGAARQRVGGRLTGALAEGPVSAVVAEHTGADDLLVVPRGALPDLESVLEHAQGVVVVVPPETRAVRSMPALPRPRTVDVGGAERLLATP